jgi:hypothetical protein
MNGFTLMEIIAVTPENAYQTWLRIESYTAMRAVLRMWMASMADIGISEDAPGSHLDVSPEEVAEGTKRTLTHRDMPVLQIDSSR